jgi:hypothetical protein
MLSDAPTYTKFNSNYSSKPNVSKSSKTGMMRCSLIDKVTHSKAKQVADEQIIQIDGFGTIYLGEVHIKQDARRISMMRLELGSPVGGSVTICGGDGNGSTYP